MTPKHDVVTCILVFAAALLVGIAKCFTSSGDDGDTTAP